MIDTSDVITSAMGTEYLSDLLCALPSYAVVQFNFYDRPAQQGLARDLPGEGRRFTVGGWEWFITPDMLADLRENLGLTTVTVLSLDVEVM